MTQEYGALQQQFGVQVEYQKLSDRELVIAHRKGQREATAEICRRYEGLVIRYGCSFYAQLVGEDYLSEMWVAFIDALGCYDTEGRIPFAGFAQSRVRFANWNFFKRCRKRWQRELYLTCQTGQDDSVSGLKWENFMAMDDTEHDALQSVMNQQQWDIVVRNMNRLSWQEKFVIYNKFYKNKSMTHIADLLGVARQTAHYHYNKAMKKLRINCKLI